MPLNLFYTMVQKSQKMTKNSNQGGGPALRGSVGFCDSWWSRQVAAMDRRQERDGHWSCSKSTFFSVVHGGRIPPPLNWFEFLVIFDFFAPWYTGPAHTVGSIGSGPDQLFRFCFLLSFEADGFARGLKLNEIEHYKLDESKSRCPRETFFVSRFQPRFSACSEKTPESPLQFLTSLIVNFSRHLYIEYIQNAQHIPAHATLRPRCHP